MATTDLKTRRSVSLKIAATICASAVAFCVGFLVTGSYYEHWVVPDLIKKYPHDGQIGLAVFVDSLNGGCIGAVLVLVFGTLWIVKAYKRTQP